MVRNQNTYESIVAWTVFVVSAFAYMLTADSSVSYWDCPEYVTCASRLEVGHPPGNPFWMLTMRVATIPFPAQLHAYVINLCSGIFMAFASAFLARIIFILMIMSLKGLAGWERTGNGVLPMAMTVSAGGALCYAFCDSAWYSAVEAEVYAMSAFLTSLTIWLMLRWAQCDDAGRKTRLLILIAYVTGLSLGVHELNLLVIPVCALIYGFRVYGSRRHPGLWACRCVLVSFAVLLLILIGVMKGVLAIAEVMELLCANRLGMTYFTGVIAAIVLMAAVVVGVIFIADRYGKKSLAATMWMAGFVILGFTSFALILIRGYASPPMNEGAPTDIFALSDYISRDQYGSKPLLYGATPYSRPMLQERFLPGTDVPDYSRYVLEKKHPEYGVYLPEARMNYRSGMVSYSDSSSNAEVVRSRHGYLISDYSFSRVMSPELNMWLPRITGNSSTDIDSYADWAAMTDSTMEIVEVSEVIDTLGNPNGRIDAMGKRSKQTSRRPTYEQNLRYFLTYQVGYMYFRYLLWNFMGRQNDFPSTGEIDHGNFITGIEAVDNAMLGNRDYMPDYASGGNPGRNVLYGIPFIFGILGIVYLSIGGRRGRRVLAVVTLFFLMTGVAIVVYLNQSPGEPRERDYSFLGSYMAFAIWIAFGIAASGVWLMKRGWHRAAHVVTAIVSIGLPAFMAFVNYDDHDRGGRSEPLRYASAILESLPPGIIFTQGDNFTFPLWYAQEVEGIGTGHAVVDISYFGMPGYVVNLMKQDERGLRLTATPSDIAYGAYAYSRIAEDADTVLVAVADMLRDVYASRDGVPEIRHRNVWLPGKNTGDTLKIDLKSLTGGGRMLQFRQLMLLDVLQTNLTSENPRPVYFLNSSSSDFSKGLKDGLRRLPHAYVYDPGMTDSTHISLLKDMTVNRINRERTSPLSTRYVDPLLADRRRRERGELVIAADMLLAMGDTASASLAIDGIAECYPYADVSAGSYTVADTTFHEGLKYASLLIDRWKYSGDENSRAMAESLLRDMLEEAKAWRRYYAYLPEWRRSTVSNSTLRLISIIPKLEEVLDVEYKTLSND